MNAQELSQRLADNVSTVVQHLLPAGKKSSGEWKVGSLSGEEGRSLSVRLTGAKRGVWRDFAREEGGDLLDLWTGARGMSISEAMADAKAFLGIRDQMPHRERPVYRRPEPPKGKPALTAVKQWLVDRGLTEETIAAFRIGEQKRDGKDIAVFQYIRDGELVNCKYRDIAEKRGMRQEKDAEPCLFGWHLVDPKARSITITEGEIDAMTLHQQGIPALSVNAGAGNHGWIESDWERLERFSEIFVAFDDDEAGRKGAAEVMPRLGIERCRRVVFESYKDANEALDAGAATREFFHAALRAAKFVDPEELVSIADFMGQAKHLLYPAAGDVQLPRLMAGDRFRDEMEFRPGEVSVWTGINGHGKSLMLNQVLIGLMVQDVRVCVFSGEMVPGMQAKRLVRQVAGLARPTPAYIDAIGAWVRDRYWVFNLVGTAALDRLLEVFKYGAKRYGIGHFVIDSLMTTDVPDDGPGSLSAQKAAMQKIVAFAKLHQVHVHLVAHPRKPRDESAAPGKMDVGGSGHLTNGADNVFSVWAAKRAEAEANPEKPDALLELLKQRNGDVQHKLYWLFFAPGAQQYCIGSQRRTVSFVNFEGAPVDVDAGQITEEA